MLPYALKRSRVVHEHAGVTQPRGYLEAGDGDADGELQEERIDLADGDNAPEQRCRQVADKCSEVGCRQEETDSGPVGFFASLRRAPHPACNAHVVQRSQE